ncbi:MAG: hypothetical protein AAGH68_13775 [Pseudomonadota bacterium]
MTLVATTPGGPFARDAFPVGSVSSFSAWSYDPRPDQQHHNGEDQEQTDHGRYGHVHGCNRSSDTAARVSTAEAGRHVWLVRHHNGRGAHGRAGSHLGRGPLVGAISASRDKHKGGPEQGKAHYLGDSNPLEDAHEIPPYRPPSEKSLAQFDKLRELLAIRARFILHGEINLPNDFMIVARFLKIRMGGPGVRRTL